MGSHKKSNQVRSLIIGAMLVSAGTAAGEKNYLAAMAPTPIRFQAARPEYDPAEVLPPLKMSDAPTTNQVETLDTAAKAEPAVTQPAETPAVTVEQTAAPDVSTTNIPAANTPAPQPVVPEARTEANQMTPQMLLRYFNKDGSREVIIPTGVEFMPPPPTAGGRSSAVYTSPPAK